MGRPKKTTADDVVAMSIRLPTPVRDQIIERATINRRSLNQEVVWLLEKALQTLDSEPESGDSPPSD
jgi:hypothetical protein